MSEHVWCQENVAAFVAGGLPLEEGERLERHLAECPECAAALAEARSLESRLAPLFQAARPGPALEDRLIRALRPEPKSRRLSLSRNAKLWLAAAAVFLLMALGAGVELLDPDVGAVPKKAAKRTDVKRGPDLAGGTILLKADEDPAAQDVDVNLGFGLERLADVSVPGPESSKNLPPGYRAVGQRVNMESTASGFASLPNSNVDIIVTKPRANSSKEAVSQVLLENVKVLAADELARDEAGKAMPARVLTFALKPQDALKLDQARKSGSISVMLRKYGETTGVGDLKMTEEAALNGKKEQSEGRKPAMPLKSADDLAKEVRELAAASLGDGKKKTAAELKIEEANLANLNFFALPQRDKSKKYERGAHFELKDFGDAEGKKAGDGKKLEEQVAELDKTVRTQKQLQDRTDKAVDQLAKEEAKESKDKSAPVEGLFWAPTEKLGARKMDESKRSLASNQGKNGKAPGNYFMQYDDMTRSEPGKDKKSPFSSFSALGSPGTSSSSSTGIGSGWLPASAAGQGTGSGKPGNLPTAPVATAQSAPQGPTVLSYVPVPTAPAPDAKPLAAEPQPAQKPAPEKPKAVEPAKAPEAPVVRRVIIRTGELEFEISSFDVSVATITRLIDAVKGGFIATINSDKLANGKVRGSVVIRIPPEHLDRFVLDLRKELGKIGELKNQRIGSTDITKQYTDLESRLRAARTMEDRLLNIIKDGKGQIKDLLLAEKELGVWRTTIEEIEGELRYYSNLASLSTLTIKLYEKYIGSAAVITESERVQAGLEVEDVEKVRKEALKAIEDVKGRVIRDELKQHSAGQFNAILHFEVSPEAAGPTRDRLRQLGRMVRLQIDRVQSTEDGSPPPKNGKIERGKTEFQLSIYNLANITPRESNVLRLAVTDVPLTYQKLRDVAGKAKAHVVNAQLNEQDKQKISAQLDFNVLRMNEAEILTALAGTGETLSRQVVRLPEGDNVTDSKVAFSISLVDADFIQPRETVTMKISAADVKSAYEKLRESLSKTKSKTRVLVDQLNDQDKRNITAQLDFTYSRADETAVQKALSSSGETQQRQVTRLPESNNVTDAKVLVHVELFSADSIQPRETLNIRIAADDLRGAFEKLRGNLLAGKARVLSAEVTEKDQQLTAQIDFTYPRTDEAAIQTALSGAGETLGRLVTRLPESPAVTDAKVMVHVELLPTDALQPRESIDTTIAVADISTAYDTLAALAGKAKGRVLVANSNKDDRGSAQLVFTFARSEENAVQAALAAAGQTLTRKVERVLKVGNYTDTRVLAIVNLEQADSLAARETVDVKIAAVDVTGAFQKLRKAIGDAKGKIISANLNEKDRVAELTFDLPRAEEPAVQTLLENLGETLSRQVARAPESTKVTDSKIGFVLKLSPDTAIPPREIDSLILEVSDVAGTMALFTQMVSDAKGRVIKPGSSQERDGKITGTAVFDVPLQATGPLLEKFKSGRNVRLEKSETDSQAPEGKLALGRIVVGLSSAEPIVPSDQGATAELRRGLSLGIWGFSRMLNWLIVGISFALPVLMLAAVGTWIGRRFIGEPRRARATGGAPGAPA